MRRKRHHKKSIDSKSSSKELELEKTTPSDVKNCEQQFNCNVSDVETITLHKANQIGISDSPSEKASIVVNNFETAQPSKMRNLLSCDLFLDCQEEDLSQVQQNFHTQEWLNYCKYNTSVHNLPSVKAANVSEIEKLLPINVASPSELPVLVFSNAPPDSSTPSPPTQIPQTSYMPFPNSVVPPNMPFSLQVPPTVSSNSTSQVPPLVSSNSTLQVPPMVTINSTLLQAPPMVSSSSLLQVPPMVSSSSLLQVPPMVSSSSLSQVPPMVSSSSLLQVPPMVSSNSTFLQGAPIVSPNSTLLQVPPMDSSNSTLSVTSPAVLQPNVLPFTAQPSIFPVRLESASAPTLSMQDEGVFPLVLQDCLRDLLLAPSKNVTPPEPKTSLGDTANEKIDEPTTNALKGTLSPPLSPDDSGNNGCMSPDLLKNFEVSFHESESDVPSVPNSSMDAMDFLSSEVASDDSGGPKILNVVCGDAGAQEYYKDDNDYLRVRVLEVDPATQKEKNNAPPPPESLSTEKIMPRTVTQWSIFSMQKTIAVISSGSLDASTINLLNLRGFIPPAFSESAVRKKLKDRLREENFLTSPVLWLIKKGFLPLNPPCDACGCQYFKINNCNDYPDSLCWNCNMCLKVFPSRRPKFFERFPMLSLEELLLLTYHWACKSRPPVIQKDVPVHEDVIFSYFTALQEICGDYITKFCSFGKTSKFPTTVEVSAVKFGKFFIICAYCRRTKLTRMQALTTEDACCTVAHIKILEQMLGEFTTLITWKKVNDCFLPGVSKCCADPTVTSVHSPGRHILNASKYLGKTLIELFQKISHDQLSLKVIQGYLDEVQWRERFGRIEESTFWNILNELSKLNTSYFTEVIFEEVSKDRYFYKQDTTFQMRWGPYRGQYAKSYSAPKPTGLPSENMVEEAIPQIGTNVASNLPAINTSIFPSVNASNLPPVNASSLPAVNIVVSLPSTSKATVDPTAFSNVKHPISITSQNAIPGKENKSSMEKITSRDLLSIKISFHEDKSLQELLRTQSIRLGQKLKSELFLLKPVQWLLDKKLINEVTSCYVCKSTAKLVDSPRYPDGVSWLCQKSDCKFENIFKRPAFFSHFGFPMEVIFGVIYHWAVQSDYMVTSKSIPLSELNIICVHRRLQKICSEISKRPSCKVGGKRRLVEVALVKFSNCFILGAMERETKLSRFRAFTIQSKLHIDEIRKTLISWLHRESTVIVNSNKYFGAYCMEERINLVFADREVKDINSKKYHTLTISNYLQNHMKNMFASVKVQFLSAELLQVYLDELVWRERYGRSPLVAFRNIMQDIFLAEYKAHDQPFGLSATNGGASASSFLTLPEVRVVLERLPDHVIEKYTRTETVVEDDEVEIIESIEKKKVVKEEVILSDDEVEAIVPDSDKSVPSSSKEKNVEEDKINDDDEVNIIHEVNINDNAVKTNDDEGKLNDDEVKMDDDKVNKIDDDEVKIINDDEVKINDDTLDEIMTDISQIKLPVIPRTLFHLPPKPIHREDSRRYSEKCYSHKRRLVLEPDSKFQCIECKELVLEDHFTKMYTCDDCKYSVYTTFCQRAFAEHRSYVLFGRKRAQNNSKDSKIHHRNALLKKWWYCSCGFTSVEGNKMASHLVRCQKSTCYSSYNAVSNLL